jgi:hypothetical protein
MITETLEKIKEMCETDDWSKAMKIQYELGLTRNEVYKIIIENNYYFGYHENFIIWLKEKTYEN